MKHESSSQREVTSAPRTGFARILEVARVGLLVVFCGPGACCVKGDQTR